MVLALGALIGEQFYLFLKLPESQLNLAFLFIDPFALFLGLCQLAPEIDDLGKPLIGPFLNFPQIMLKQLNNLTLLPELPVLEPQRRLIDRHHTQQLLLLLPPPASQLLRLQRQLRVLCLKLIKRPGQPDDSLALGVGF